LWQRRDVAGGLWEHPVGPRGTHDSEDLRPGLRPTVKHGGWGYACDQGCRCDVCVQAHNDHHRELRARRAKWSAEDNPKLTRHPVDVQQPRMPLPGLLPGAGRLEPCATQQGEAQMIPRHEIPGRIVLSIGLFTSSLCVVGLIILWLG
jgi:hypothetical protein